MDIQSVVASLKKPNTSKIIVLIADGLGGLPLSPEGKTELESATTPHMDNLVKQNICGMMTPVLPGITPGSGPGHLGLFGYDPLKYEIGRGVLETLGIDFDLQPNDIAARGNFCTVDSDGKITDRRAGRISTDTCRKLVEKLRSIKLENVEYFLEPVQDYRFALILRGSNARGDVEDTDPQAVGLQPLTAKAKNPESSITADVINSFITQAADILRADHPANMITFRGIGKKPAIPTLKSLHGLNAAAICVYPMYRGLARLVGMTIVPPVANIREQIDTLKKIYTEFDYFFIHFKYTDSTGEDGKFDDKVKKIEELDSYIPEIVSLNPDVFVITGDHSSPAAMKAHSFHPVPVVLASNNCRPDASVKFGESDCLRGGLGQFEAKTLMPLLLAHAFRLEKFGA